jgi:hypothetical protein
MRYVHSKIDVHVVRCHGILARMMDDAVRAQAFLWLRDQASRYDYVIPRPVLEYGFLHGGSRIHLAGEAR